MYAGVSSVLLAERFSSTILDRTAVSETRSAAENNVKRASNIRELLSKTICRRLVNGLFVYRSTRVSIGGGRHTRVITGRAPFKTKTLFYAILVDRNYTPVCTKNENPFDSKSVVFYVIPRSGGRRLKPESNRRRPRIPFGVIRFGKTFRVNAEKLVNAVATYLLVDRTDKTRNGSRDEKTIRN